MAEPKIMVSLTHEQWQWVMSLVLNSAYLRARPIVEAVEAAVGQHTEDMNAAATRERSQREEIVGQLYTAQRELQQGKREITNLKQQVAGYLQAAKRAKRAQRTKGAK
jgi:flagellar motility protein MotE (MotC chaperone)